MLERHVTLHSFEFACEQCNKTYPDQRILNMHVENCHMGKNECNLLESSVNKWQKLPTKNLTKFGSSILSRWLKRNITEGLLKNVSTTSIQSIYNYVTPPAPLHIKIKSMQAPILPCFCAAHHFVHSLNLCNYSFFLLRPGPL